MTSPHDDRRLPMHPIRWCVALSMMVIAFSGAAAQDGSASVPPPYRKQSLTLCFGAGFLHSRSGIMSFWEMGAGGSALFMVNVKRELAFGLGLDIARLNFKNSAFQSTFPGIPLRRKNITMGALSLAMVYSPFPTMRFSPFAGATLGATRLSQAVYRETVDSVRVTYYNIAGRTRLTLGITAGADVVLVRWLALHVEAKTTYIHNDPDVGFASFLRGGVRLTL